MKIVADRTGFPMVEVGPSGCMHLWPVTKVQFENFLCEPGRFGDSWYESVCKFNPRVSFRKFNKTNYEGILLSGIAATEALEYARWLGEDFDLPTVKEWRAFYRTMSQEVVPDAPPPELSEPAAAIWRKLSSFTTEPLKFSLLSDGMLEWTRENGSFAGLGGPRPSFLPNAWDPLYDTVRVVSGRERVFCLGFRLIKRAPPGISSNSFNP